jgi:hypothetical protein
MDEMTDVQTRPVPLLVGALTTSLWAAVVGIAPLAAVVLVVWVAGASMGTGATDAARFALGGWLLAHGVPLRIGGAPLGLAPLGLTAVVVWQLVRAGTNTARAVGADGLRLGARVAGAVAGTYAVTGGVVALVASSDRLSVSFLYAVLATGVVAAVASAAGVLRIPEIRRELASRLGARVVDVLRGGALAAAGVLAAGSLLAALRVVLTADHAAELIRSLGGGPVGTIGVLVLCLLYAPTSVIWAAAYLLGPGFAIGSGTSVTPFGVDLGPLPAMPLLAGLPEGPVSTAAAWIFVLPVAAGVLAGIRIARARAGDWRDLLAAAALTGPVAGLLLGFAALLAGGPLGGGRLAAVGPSGWQVALASTLGVGLAAVAGASVHRGLRRRVSP